MKFVLKHRHAIEIHSILKSNNIPYRYIHRVFTLVNMIGDYGIFVVKDRKRPFTIHMKCVEMCK